MLRQLLVPEGLRAGATGDNLVLEYTFERPAEIDKVELLAAAASAAHLSVLEDLRATPTIELITVLLIASHCVMDNATADLTEEDVLALSSTFNRARVVKYLLLIL